MNFVSVYDSFSVHVNVKGSQPPGVEQPRASSIMSQPPLPNIAGRPNEH